MGRDKEGMSGEGRGPRFISIGRASSAFHLRIQVPRISAKTIITNVVSTLIGAVLSLLLFPADDAEVTAAAECQEAVDVLAEQSTDAPAEVVEPERRTRAMEGARRFVSGGLRGMIEGEEP